MAAVTEPYEEGIKTEHRYAKMLFHSSQAKALQYAFFAQRAAPKVAKMFSCGILYRLDRLPVLRTRGTAFVHGLNYY